MKKKKKKRELHTYSWKKISFGVCNSTKKERISVWLCVDGRKRNSEFIGVLLSVWKNSSTWVLELMYLRVIWVTLSKTSYLYWSPHYNLNEDRLVLGVVFIYISRDGFEK